MTRTDHAQSIDNFPTLKDAALEIAYDNGHINRDCREAAFLDKVGELISADGADLVDLQQIEAFLAELPREDLDTLCNGEYSESQTILNRCRNKDLRERVNGLLDDIFDL